MRNFVLKRDEDVTGISGTGIVAEGVIFSDGRAVVCWLSGEHHSVVVWDSIEDVRAINCHGNKTKILYV